MTPRPGRPLVLATAGGAAAGGNGRGAPGPRVDYHELAGALDAQVVAPVPRSGPLRTAREQVRRLGYWDLAWRAKRADPPLVLSMSEKVGLCVSLLDGGGPRHTVIAHNLTTPRRRSFQRWTRWLDRPDRVIVISRPQEVYLRDELGLDGSRARFVPYHVDERFFSPQGRAEEGYVLSVGQTGRDYPTLFECLRQSRAPAVVIASSRWIAQREISLPDLPPVTSVRHGLSYGALREAYDAASVVVVALLPGLVWAAGVTSVLEAMAMAKPLVVSATPGLAGYVSDGENALVVPPGDASALAAAVARLLDDRELAARLGSAARRRVESMHTLERYVSTVAGVAAETLGGR